MNSFLTPFKESFLFKIIIAIVLFFYSLITSEQIVENSDVFKILKSKDSIIFERVFNKCELEKLEPIIAQNFEFYHDVAGIQNREAFIHAIENNICKTPGTFTRKRVKNSLEVFELKENGKIYGAIQRGKHDFYSTENKNTKKTGTAKFTHLWILEDNTWKLKRVLSFDHKDAIE